MTGVQTCALPIFTFPLALIRRRVASIYIFALVVFLLTVRVLLGHPFILGLLPLLVAYLPFRHAKVFVSSVLRMRSQFS